MRRINGITIWSEARQRQTSWTGRNREIKPPFGKPFLPTTSYVRNSASAVIECQKRIQKLPLLHFFSPGTITQADWFRSHAVTGKIGAMVMRRPPVLARFTLHPESGLEKLDAPERTSIL